VAFEVAAEGDDLRPRLAPDGDALAEVALDIGFTRHECRFQLPASGRAPLRANVDVGCPNPEPAHVIVGHPDHGEVSRPAQRNIPYRGFARIEERLEFPPGPVVTVDVDAEETRYEEGGPIQGEKATQGLRLYLREDLRRLGLCPRRSAGDTGDDDSEREPLAHGHGRSSTEASGRIKTRWGRSGPAARRPPSPGARPRLRRPPTGCCRGWPPRRRAGPPPRAASSRSRAPPAYPRLRGCRASAPRAARTSGTRRWRRASGCTGCPGPPRWTSPPACRSSGGPLRGGSPRRAASPLCPG